MLLDHGSYILPARAQLCIACIAAHRIAVLLYRSSAYLSVLKRRNGLAVQYSATFEHSHPASYVS